MDAADVQFAQVLIALITSGVELVTAIIALMISIRLVRRIWAQLHMGVIDIPTPPHR